MLFVTELIVSGTQLCDREFVLMELIGGLNLAFLTLGIFHFLFFVLTVLFVCFLLQQVACN